VVAGTIGRRGSMIVTTCKVFSIEQKKVVFTQQFISMGEADLTNTAAKMSDAIVAAILRSGS
jgi:hypothetical protein